MSHEEFMNDYGNYLEHKWVSSKDKAKAAEQKKREQEYNAQYYREHRQEILDDRRKAQAEESMRRYHRNFTPKEALTDLNERQNNFPYTDEQKNAYRQNLADRYEQLDLDIRNRRMAETGKAQGERERGKYLRSKYAERNSQTSTAQSEASARQREYNRKKRTASAQSEQLKSDYLAKKGARLQKEYDARNAKASSAQEQSARGRSAYQQSIEGKVSRAVSRTGAKINNGKKKVTNAINSGKATVQRVKDTISDTSERINKIKKNVSIILNKYFG